MCGMSARIEHAPVQGAEAHPPAEAPSEDIPYAWQPWVASGVFIAVVSLYLFVNVESLNATPTYTWGDEAVWRFFAQFDLVKLPVFFVMLCVLAYGASEWRKSRT
jgi:hypothetical protein